MHTSSNWRGIGAGLLAFTAAVTLSAGAFAQGVGVVSGAVRDVQTKKPVADVVVTLTSPALQGEQVVVTDASGLFRVPNLPPGAYTLTLEKEQYQPYSRSDITVRVDSTIRVNSDLLPEKVVLKADEVVVVASAPTVDVGSSATGVNVNSDFASRIALNPPSGKGATARSFESMAEVAPGAVADQYGVSISGTTSVENQYVVDGLSVNNPDVGVIGTPLSVEFVKEVNVITGGYMPEYGRATGGYLDVVTKSGSNEFHGSVFSSISPGFLEGPRTPVIHQGSTITTDVKLSSSRDFGVELGGPIRKDKLWFYVGVSPSFVDYRLTRNLNITQLRDNKPLTDENGLIVTSPIPGTTKYYAASQQSLGYIAKLTWLINQDNTVSVSVYGAPSFSGGSGHFGLNPNDGSVEIGSTSWLVVNPGGGINGTFNALAHEYVSTPTNTVLKWSSAFNNKHVLIDATLGWHHEDNAIRASDGSRLGSGEGLSTVPLVWYQRTSPGLHSINDVERSKAAAAVCDPAGTMSAVLCPVSNYFAGGPGQLSEPTLDRWQGKAVLTGLLTGLGHHVAKAGVDIEVTRYHSVTGLSGTNLFQEDATDPAFTDFLRPGFLVGPDKQVELTKFDAVSKSATLGGFVQDSWSIADKVTLNAGVRYDAQLIFGDDGKPGITLPNEVSPRVGVIYDFTQSGHSKLFANFARFYEGVPLDMVDRALPGQHYMFAVSDPSACTNPTDPAQYKTVCNSNDTRLPITAPTDPNQKFIKFNADKDSVDPDLKPQSSDEIVLGGEYEVFANGRVGVQYTKRWQNRIIEDMSRDNGSSFFIGNPGYGMATDFPKPVRNYDAFTVYFQKSFSDLWLVQASYTVSYLRGNWSGLFIPETGTIIPNLSPDFDLPVLVKNRLGPLPGDSTHSIKIFGAKDFVLPRSMILSLGLSYRGRSGGPTNFLGANPVDGADSVFILPRGSGERLPWVHDIDSHIGFGVKLAKDSTLFLTMDTFNLFNFQAATALDQRFTQDTVLPIEGGTKSDLGKLKNADGTAFDANDRNPNFGKPSAYQPPRTFRFGAKVTF